MIERELICKLKFLGFSTRTNQLIDATVIYKDNLFIYIYNHHTIRISDNNKLTRCTSYDCVLRYVTEND